MALEHTHKETLGRARSNLRPEVRNVVEEFEHDYNEAMAAGYAWLLRAGDILRMHESYLRAEMMYEHLGLIEKTE